MPVLEGVASSSWGSAQFILSRSGTLAYVARGIDWRTNATLVWVDRRGVEQPLTETEGPFDQPRLSPDGQRVAVVNGNPRDIWILALARDTLTRLTFDEGVDTRPVWSADGRRILFASNRNEGTVNLFWKPADGSGAAEQLTTGVYRAVSSISSDGNTILFRQEGEASS